jgi:hypothetical protein
VTTNVVELVPGASFGVGSLPHRDALEAAHFSLGAFGIPTIPTLPRRSPAEGMIAQALVGMPGIALGQYGSVAIDASAVDADAPCATDLQHDAFAGFRAFLEVAADHGLAGPVKFQVVGPVTLGAALVRAGLDTPVAFDVAQAAVRERIGALSRALAAALPDAAPIVVLDEPAMAELMDAGFPIAPESAIDLLSGAMAVAEPFALVGVHCCSPADWATVLASGPALLSLAARSDVAESAGYIARFIEDGGFVAWGAVATNGPVGWSAERSWRELSELWCTLVQRGCEPALLRRQSLVTPECGLGPHTPAIAAQVCELVGEVGRRIHDQAVATRFVLGA